MRVILVTNSIHLDIGFGFVADVETHSFREEQRLGNVTALGSICVKSCKSAGW
ncbi:hypothetical protein [Arcanobacterium bovis]|uniref:hypothetical protein n=1 Tax=Arcanobacterium bovis TaxID=2529275 RepID=UPI0013F1592D|nr:hypothetical protein [Arcanobacterium bovis]